MKNNFADFGYILIDKPVNRSSHYVIYYLRKLTGIQRIGHAGTLDPFASGLLLVAVGRPATREIARFVKLDKEYLADIFLGAATDTQDRTGNIIAGDDKEKSAKKIFKKEIAGSLTKKEIAAVLKKFLGAQNQLPPMYSAKKINGQRLYKLARKGQEVGRPSRRINILSLKIIRYKWPDLQIKVRCSSGTYIRTLADDLGRRLGCGAYLKELRRLKIGRFSINKAVKLEKLNAKNWRRRLFRK